MCLVKELLPLLSIWRGAGGEVLQKRKHFHLHMQQHFVGGLVFKNTPAQFVLVNALVAARDIELARKPGNIFFACPFGIPFAFGFQVVQPLQENEVGYLLNSSQWVGNAAFPKFCQSLSISDLSCALFWSIYFFFGFFLPPSLRCKAVLALSDVTTFFPVLASSSFLATFATLPPCLATFLLAS